MKAELLLRGGPIYRAPDADAVAVAAGRILAVGRGPHLADLIGSTTRIIELDGRPVWPGLVDAHVHLEALAWQRERLDLGTTHSIGEVRKLVAERAGELPRGAWIVGQGWLRDRLERWPLAADLDPCSPHNPVALASHDTHALWVNSLALRLAGIDALTDDPPGGRITRATSGDAGDPDGLLLESATDLVWRAIPPPGRDRRVAALRGTMAAALAMGLVGVHDFDGPETLDLLKELDAHRALSLRVTYGVNRETLEAEDQREIFGGMTRLRVGLVKLFADGALGSRTAWMLEPYCGSSDRGIPRLQRDELVYLTRRARARGLGVAVHAIGDAAVRLVLDAFEIARSDPTPAAPAQILRIEHAQLIHPDDLPRFAKLGVVASMQPNHCSSDRLIAQQLWGARCSDAYAWQSILASGGLLAIGTDAPVEPLNPLLNLHAAVTRQDPAGNPPGGWYPHQRLTLEQAVSAASLGAARATGEAWSRGTIDVGKFADLAVLSEPLDGAMPDTLRRAKVDLVAIEGQVAYERAESTSVGG